MQTVFANKITPAEHLQFTLEDAEMTPADFAAASGIPLSRVEGILSGEIAPEDADAVATAAAWNMSANCWRGLFGLPKKASRTASSNVMFWTTPERKERIRAAAAARHVTITAYVLAAVDAALAADGAAPVPAPRRRKRKATPALAD